MSCRSPMRVCPCHSNGGLEESEHKREWGQGLRPSSPQEGAHLRAGREVGSQKTGEAH